MEPNRKATSVVVGLAVLRLATEAGATTYRFSPGGDDSRTALEAGSPSTPWKSLAKLGSVALQPGDSILLERGGTWRETLRLDASGSQTRPIVIASFGTDPKLPQIFGSQPVVGGGSSEHVAKLPGIVKGLYDQGAPVRMSRYPDTGWMVATSVEGDSALTSTSLVGKDWTGASIHVRASLWGLGTVRVRSSQGGRVSFPGTMELVDSVRFYMGNHPSGMLPGRSSWWFSSVDSTLHWSHPGSATDAILEAALREYGIHLGANSNVVVRGIRVFATTRTAILTSGSNVRIEDCQIDFPGRSAIDYSGRGVRILRNSVVGAAENAVVGHGAGHRVEGNSVRRTARKEEFGPDGMGPGCCTGHGIVLNGDSSVIAANRVDSSGYCGISFFGKLDSIRENVISNSCLTIDDCGGIYTITGNYANAGSTGGVVRRNIVRDAIGAPSGWANPHDAAQGIYLDDGSHDILVDSNVVSGSASGVFLHNNQRNTIRGNVLYGNRRAQILMQRDGNAGTEDMKDNLIEGNAIVYRSGERESEVSSGPQTASPARWQGNVSCYDRGLRVVCRRDRRVVVDVERVGRDHPSLGPELLANFGFDSASRAWVSWPGNTSLSIDSGAPCGVGKCLRVLFGPAELAQGPMVNSGNPISVQQGRYYRLGFRSRAAAPLQTLVPVLRRSHTDYANLIEPVEVRIDSVWTGESQVLRATLTEARSRLDFHSGTGDSLYWLDDVSLREIPDSLRLSLPGSRLFANSGTTAMRVDLQGEWFDQDGVRRTSLELAPLSGAVLFARDGQAKVGAGRSHRTAIPMRAFRVGRTWRIVGIRGPVSLVDAGGRLVASLQPDSRGEVVWDPKRVRGVHWAVQRGESVPIFAAP